MVKKISGYDNTKSHGILQALATICAAIGWYIIHTNKNLMKKQHLLTLHGKLGAAVCIGYILLSIIGGIALHPDFGIMRTNKTIRLAHRYFARVTTAAAWVSCFLGYQKLQDDTMYQLALGLPLLIIGVFVLF